MTKLLAWLKTWMGNLLIGRIKSWMNPKETPDGPPAKKPIDPSDPFAGA